MIRMIWVMLARPSGGFMHRRSVLFVIAWFVSGHASAEEPASPRAPADPRLAAPTVAFAYSVPDDRAGSVGALAYGTATTTATRPTLGGGALLFGSPVDRLTLVGDFGRNTFGRFAPSAAGLFRIAGRANEGFSLAGLAKYKIEGFGVGPKNEIESELEGGLVASYAQGGLHADVNGVTGFGLGDEGEVDAEGRARVGYDIGSHVRLGLDGQARYRLRGTFQLPGNRDGDYAFGPQTIVAFGRILAAFTAGPSSMGLVDGSRAIGWTSFLSVGGTN
jgi:hypothetical protein